MSREERARLIAQHVSAVGVTACPPGSAVKPSRRKAYYSGKRGQGGCKSARSPFFIRGGGCV